MSILQLDFDGNDRVAVAINRLREHEPPEGYYLAFSGGKDSVVIHDLATRSGVKFDAHYNVSPIDPPEIYSFIRDYYQEVAWDKHAKGFWNLVVKKGMPTRWVRWCCSIIKEGGGTGRTIVMGVRRAESIKRRGRSVLSRDWKRKGTFFCLPIVDWTEDEVWEYIYARNAPYCSLYDEGFERLGCVLCPLIGGWKRRRDLDRFPKIARNWKLACERRFQRGVEQGKDQPFQSAEDYWQWWVSLGK